MLYASSASQSVQTTRYQERCRIPPSTDQNEHRTNDRIRAREVRLIGPDGAQLGVKPLPEALSIARRLDLDLVEVASEANPPVCRIMDFNRFKYEAAQRAKESKRKSTSAGIKEMKYRPKIGVGDFDTKTRQVARFLGEGHKVKITIMFRGREMSHPDLGKKILDQVAEQVEGVGKVEAAPKLDGRNMIMVLAPERRPQTRKPVSAPGQALPADSASQAQTGTAASLDSPLADTGLLPDGAPAEQEQAGGANGAEVSNPVDAAHGGMPGRAGAANTAAGAS